MLNYTITYFEHINYTVNIRFICGGYFFISAPRHRVGVGSPVLVGRRARRPGTSVTAPDQASVSQRVAHRATVRVAGTLEHFHTDYNNDHSNNDAKSYPRGMVRI